MEDMLYLEMLGELYSSLNPSEKNGLRFGMLPARMLEALRENRVSITDLMEYDDIIRSAW